jgi:hypothetical protein
MKTDTIQQLLEHYQQGTLSDSEVAELNRLTHRDEVMASAEQRARGIVRRRWSVVAAVAGLVVSGAVAIALLAPGQVSETLVAEAEVPEVVTTSPEPLVEQQPEAAAPVVPATAKQRVATVRPAAVQHVVEAVAVHTVEDEDPVVMCNNQCEADSVINDIWKFLTV